MPATARKAAPPATRTDVVFIRKSTTSQDEQAQRANVAAMLKEHGVYVAERHWFSGTVGRRKVRANAEFNVLMGLVEADKVGTVYVESQTRWGTADRTELFTLLGTLRQHGTRLYDLREKKDLTEKDLATELLAIVTSIKSEKELQDISYQSLRTRVNNFKDRGSWPTGPHPFAYGKECRDASGRLLWVWQPTGRDRRPRTERADQEGDRPGHAPRHRPAVHPGRGRDVDPRAGRRADSPQAPGRQPEAGPQRRRRRRAGRATGV
jgi:DNA invertase Pin-like site-specific DNA recombinase